MEYYPPAPLCIPSTLPVIMPSPPKKRWGLSGEKFDTIFNSNMMWCASDGPFSILTHAAFFINLLRVLVLQPCV